MENELEKVDSGQLQLSNPEHIKAFSETLKKYITQNKLSTPIKGKDYVLVDGWKFAGLNFGITPIPSEPINESTPDEIKYRCNCDLIHMATGNKIGFGTAICSNKEQKKKYFDEYAILSMAQTRAISKAIRNLLGFVMLSAGFQDTPAEEMNENYATQGRVEFDDAMKKEIDGFKTEADLLIWLNDNSIAHKNLHDNSLEFRAYVNKVCKKLRPKKK